MTASNDREGTWMFDSGEFTRIHFKARGFWGSIGVEGAFRNARGSVNIGPDGRTDCVMEIDVDSIETGISVRDHHLVGADLLDATTYPTIGFGGTAVHHWESGMHVEGTLAIKGTTRGHGLDVASTLDGEALQASTSSVISLSDYKIQAPLGMLRPTVAVELAARLIRV
ncbi:MULTISPECIES: YceI family protein [unclassified Rhodococcus (in: high G+C Gram-positive bacteria)]|uniref:YceI family protein n=1 Tax=unclassified Rhodococcus (in: high G+C Gram-positive bacteria) TaxID=192944 RepID=UPI0011405536|nr:MULTISPECIES: YceI family protein [unclassified Rhodococcus (in: high G+C Gram-positive bacteria)]